MISYLVLTLDVRSVAQANYFIAGCVNALLAFLSFAIVKRISSAKGMKEQFGYTIGGTVGVEIGIFLSKIILGK